MVREEQDGKVIEYDEARWSFGKPIRASRAGTCTMCNGDFGKRDPIYFLHWINPESDDQSNGSREDFERVHVGCVDDIYVAQMPTVQESLPEREFQIFTDWAVKPKRYYVVDSENCRVYAATVQRKAEGVLEYLSGKGVPS